MQCWGCQAEPGAWVNLDVRTGKNAASAVAFLGANCTAAITKETL